MKFLTGLICPVIVSVEYHSNSLKDFMGANTVSVEVTVAHLFDSTLISA